jgi:hypothetical protein
MRERSRKGDRRERGRHINSEVRSRYLRDTIYGLRTKNNIITNVFQINIRAKSCDRRRGKN